MPAQPVLRCGKNANAHHPTTSRLAPGNRAQRVALEADDAEAPAVVSPEQQQAADGGTALVTGSDQTADGAGELASGLHTAADEIPSYTDDEAQTLASVVADPVEADGIGSDLFGATAVPLLAALALWIGNDHFLKAALERILP